MSDREVRKERSGWRDPELAERHTLWGLSLPSASSKLTTPPPISPRHRKWGWDCPTVDLDFPMLEYNHAIPLAIIDYKLRTLHSSEPDRYHPTHQAMGDLAQKYSDGALPYLAVFYLKNPWVFRLIPMNDEADRRLKSRSHILSERNYVTWLYKMRGIPLPLPIAQQLDTYCPSKKVGTEVEALSNLIDEVEQSSLFTVDEVSA